MSAPIGSSAPLASATPSALPVTQNPSATPVSTASTIHSLDSPAESNIFSSAISYIGKTFLAIFDFIAVPFVAFWNFITSLWKEPTCSLWKEPTCSLWKEPTWDPMMLKMDLAALNQLAVAIEGKNDEAIQKAYNFPLLSKHATELLSKLQFDLKAPNSAIVRAAIKNVKFIYLIKEVFYHFAMSFFFEKQGLDVTLSSKFGQLPQELQNAFKHATWKLVGEKQKTTDPDFGGNYLKTADVTFVISLLKAAQDSLKQTTDLNVWNQYMPEKWKS